jgi:hypothetical protein
MNYPHAGRFVCKGFATILRMQAAETRGNEGKARHETAMKTTLFGPFFYRLFFHMKREKAEAQRKARTGRALKADGWDRSIT